MGPAEGDEVHECAVDHLWKQISSVQIHMIMFREPSVWSHYLVIDGGILDNFPLPQFDFV